MAIEVLDLTNQEMQATATQVSKLIEEKALFQLRTMHEPEALIAAIKEKAESAFTWETAAKGSDGNLISISKTQSCCGVCTD